MAEINKKELARIVGHDEDAEHLKKEVRIIKDAKGQHSIRIPKKFAQQAKINPETDTFTFTLTPQDEEGNQFTIEAKLNKN